MTYITKTAIEVINFVKSKGEYSDVLYAHAVCSYLFFL